jgi:hypothetical protein
MKVLVQGRTDPYAEERSGQLVQTACLNRRHFCETAHREELVGSSRSMNRI